MLPYKHRTDCTRCFCGYSEVVTKRRMTSDEKMNGNGKGEEEFVMRNIYLFVILYLDQSKKKCRI